MDLVRRLATAVTGLSRLHDRVLVGIDGPDGEGKTTLAGRLSDALRRPTQQACVDGFSRPRAQRHRRGELSPDGYHLDSFDYQGLHNECLLPFLGGQSVVRASGYERDADSRADVAVVVPARAVLVVEEVVLLRPELRELWTVTCQ
jgi:uridine kinase